MPIINLTIKGKQAIGDGTKIVCMNSDYVVRITLEDCETLVEAPVKKLVVKCGRDYRQADVDTVIEDGQSFLQAVLPIIESQSTIELGVCGKETNSQYEEPKFTSQPAIFDCVKSVLCGAVVLKAEPKLDTLAVTENGKYRAADKDVDGFYEVDVNVTSKLSESRVVDLSMADGNQEIVPSGTNRTMDKVTVTKPVGLVSTNIRKGVNIGGVVGTYEQKLVEQTIYTNGEYIPVTGTDGFSKVIVNVNEYNIEKTVGLGDTFAYDYDSYVDINVLPTGIVTYTDVNGVITFTGASFGICSITLRDFDSAGNVVKTVNYSIKVIDTAGTVSGTLDITENGVYFVADKESVNVNVPIPEGYIEESVMTESFINIDAMLGGV